MRDRTFYWTVNSTGVLLVAAALSTLVHRLGTIERPLPAALAYLGVAVWLTIGEAMRRRFVRHVAEHHCIEHIGHTYPAMVIPIAATWPLIALLHAWCHRNVPANSHA